MYCSISDIENHLNKETLLLLADDDKNGIIDDEIVEAAIRHSDSIIDSFIRNRFSVPFSLVPDLIRTISTDLAIGNLFARCPLIAGNVVREKYIDAIRTLSRLADGEIELGADIQPVKRNLPESSSSPEEKLFSHNTLEPF